MKIKHDTIRTVQTHNLKGKSGPLKGRSLLRGLQSFVLNPTLIRLHYCIISTLNYTRQSNFKTRMPSKEKLLNVKK